MRRPLIATIAVLATAFCLSSCSPDDPDTSDSSPDSGTVPIQLLPPNDDAEGPPGIDEALTVVDKTEEGWIAAPWALALPADPKSDKVAVIYVAGDQICYGPASFTVEQTKSKVTIASHVTKTGSTEKCPESPAGAFKWGTLTLDAPLGKRELVHAGVDKLFKDFSWDKFTAKPSAPGEAKDSEDTEAE